MKDNLRTYGWESSRNVLSSSARVSNYIKRRRCLPDDRNERQESRRQEKARRRQLTTLFICDAVDLSTNVTGP